MRELKKGEVEVGMYVVVELYDGYGTEGVVTSVDSDTNTFVVGYNKIGGGFCWGSGLTVFLNEKVTNEIKLITPITKSAGNVSCGYLEDGQGGRTLAITKTKSTELSEGEVKEGTISPTKSEWTDKHYDHYYTLTPKDIAAGKIKIDPYFVNIIWGINDADKTGAAFHNLKTLSRMAKNKNSLAREWDAMIGQSTRARQLMKGE